MPEPTDHDPPSTIYCEKCDACLTEDECAATYEEQLCFDCAAAEFWRGFNEAARKLKIEDMPTPKPTRAEHDYLGGCPPLRKWKAGEGC